MVTDDTQIVDGAEIADYMLGDAPDSVRAAMAWDTLRTIKGIDHDAIHAVLSELLILAVTEEAPWLEKVEAEFDKL